MKLLATFLIAIGITAFMASCGGNSNEKKAEQYLQKAYDEIKDEHYSSVFEDFYVIYKAAVKAKDNINADGYKKIHAICVAIGL